MLDPPQVFSPAHAFVWLLFPRLRTSARPRLRIPLSSHLRTDSMSEYSAVPPPGAAGMKKDAFADAVQRARQVSVTRVEREGRTDRRIRARFVVYLRSCDVYAKLFTVTAIAWPAARGANQIPRYRRAYRGDVQPWTDFRKTAVLCLCGTTNR